MQGTEAAGAPAQGAEASEQPQGATPNGGDTQAGEQVKAAAAEAKRRFKIDDQEVDEDEVLKVYRERKGHQQKANKEYQEGLKSKKQAEEFIKMMKDPEQVKVVMEKLGYTRQQLREMSEKLLAAELEEEMLDPREKEYRQTKAELEAYKAKQKALEDSQKKKLEDDLREKYSKEYSDQFVEAIKESNLPPTKQMVARMAGYIKRYAHDLNVKITPQEAAKLVKEDVLTEKRHLLKEMSGEQLYELMGEDGFQKVRGFDTGRLKDPAAHLKTPEVQGEGVRKRDPSVKRMSPAEWRAFNKK